MYSSNLVLHVRLTPREEDILTWIARGKTRAEIALILSLSEDSIKTYTERARRKLNAVNTTQAATLALALGLISPYKDITWMNAPSHSYDY